MTSTETKHDPLNALVRSIFGERRANQMRYAEYLVEAEVLDDDKCFALFALEHGNLSFREIAQDAYHAAEAHDSLECARFAKACMDFNKYMAAIQLSIYRRCKSLPQDTLEENDRKFTEQQNEQIQRLDEIILKLENKEALARGPHH